MIENEDLVNMPNWLPLSFRPRGGEWLNLRRDEILEFRQFLDLYTGVLHRELRIRDREGRETNLATRRIVHMAEPHLAAIEWRIRPENWSGRIEVRAGLDGTVINAGVERYRQLNGKHLAPVETRQIGPNAVLLVTETNQSRLRVALAARTRVSVPADRALQQEPDHIAQILGLEARQGEEITVEKTVALFTSRDHAISEPALA
ncbi:MAG: beta-phosphoglucomutase family hydrolase, partial [Hyphomicrobiales bacterium]